MILSNSVTERFGRVFAVIFLITIISPISNSSAQGTQTAQRVEKGLKKVSESELRTVAKKGQIGETEIDDKPHPFFFVLSITFVTMT